MTQKNTMNQTAKKLRGLAPADSSSGFSLIETMASVSILVILASAAAFTFRSMQNNALLQNGEFQIVRTLEEARSRAATGYGTDDHGVHIEYNKIISFEGDTYAAGIGITRLLPPGITTNQENTSIIFKRLSAEPNSAVTVLVLGTGGNTRSVGVSVNGAITPEQ